MQVLICNNVDSQGDVWCKYETPPTKEDLVNLFKDYYHLQDTAGEIADGLLTSGQHDVNDAACTEFILEGI